MSARQRNEMAPGNLTRSQKAKKRRLRRERASLLGRDETARRRKLRQKSSLKDLVPDLLPLRAFLRLSPKKNLQCKSTW